MTKYKCVRACIWRGKYFSAGEIYESSDSKDSKDRPPYHFEIIDKSEPVKTNKPVKAKDVKELKDMKESEAVVKNE